MMVDSHCHLTMRQFEKDREEVVRRALAELDLLITVGVTLDDIRKALALFKDYDRIFIAAGIHPHFAKEIKDEDLDEMKSIIESERKVVGVGEIGLDFRRKLSPPEVQIKRFYDQIQIAKELDLPVVIHDREAHEEVLKIIKETRPFGVIHCFSGDWELACEFLKLDFFISIPTPVTYRENTKLQEVARNAPLDRILVETDAPYLAPEPFRGKRNEPIYVKYAIEKIAEIRELSFEEVAFATLCNTMKAFGIKMEGR